MNIVFTALTLISLVILTATQPSTAFPTMIEGVRNAILLILKLTAIYAVWLSVLKMMQATELDKKLSNGLKPIIKRIFKHENDEAYKWISINLASNMLGMGGATTPAGIKAMNAMYRDDNRASDNMLMLLVINATSIQLIPATVIALRATAGSADAASIFLPTLISSGIATLLGCVLCKLFSKKEGNSTPINIPNQSKLSPTAKFFKLKKPLHTTSKNISIQTQPNVNAKQNKQKSVAQNKKYDSGKKSIKRSNDSSLNVNRTMNSVFGEKRRKNK
ncbi:MAG: hypothetical protein RSB59_03950 [Clostridia bacterium]